MEFDVIIPAAGYGQRMGSKEPKGLISLGIESVIQRQIRQLYARYPGVRIIVVGGHKHDKLYKSLPPETSFVLNNDYANGNVAQSIKVGMEYTKSTRPTLVIYGDLVFNEQALPEVWPDSSTVIVDESELRDDEVGVSEKNGKVVLFAFGLPVKWSHIAMLMPKEKQIFLEGCRPAHHFRFFGYELLNYVLQNGGHFNTIRPPGMQLVEIDTSKDILKALELVNEDSMSTR